MAASECGSIGRAAEQEFIAASAASKRIADLELAVGTPLFYRRARGVELTPAGQTLLHHARAVRGSTTAVLVRVPAREIDTIKRALDLGVDGIILPLVRKLNA